MQRATCMFLALLLASSSGCATFLAKDQEIIHVTSNPPGAQISVDGMAMGATPAQIAVDAHQPHQITITAPGQAPITCYVQANVGVIWVVLDILFGVLPLVVDAVTGDWTEVDRNFCTANFIGGGGGGGWGAPPPGGPAPAPGPAPGPAPAPGPSSNPY